MINFKGISVSYTKLSGAQGETRTLTPVKAGDFESPASTIPPLGPKNAVILYTANQLPDIDVLTNFIQKVK